MCIAAPAKIVLIDEESNICAADFGGVRQNARLDLLPDAKIGDYGSFRRRGQRTRS